MIKSKFPNASILSLITQQGNDKEKLLFIYLKPVPDFYSLKQIHWYEGAGKDGKSSMLWPALSIRQWVACGSDKQIKESFATIISAKKLKINQVVIELEFPTYSVESGNDNRKRSRSDVKMDFLKVNNLSFFPLEFYQKENLQLLSGYSKKTDEITPVFPGGFVEDGFIHSHLEKNIFGVIETRTPYLTFHGVRSLSEKDIGTKEIVGFYQNVFDEQKRTALVRDENGHELGRSDIDSDIGFFKISLSQPNKSGSVEILADNSIEDSIDYHFIQEIQVTGHISSATYNDSYGRNFMITADQKKRPVSTSSVTWQQSVFANALQANTKLADLFKKLFDYLGPRIVVADPYFLGNFKQDDITKVITISHCQQAFLAALIHSAVEKGVSQLTILGCSRATSQLDSDSASQLEKVELMIERYEKLFKRMIEDNKLHRILPSSSISFKRAISDFHSRYWFSLATVDEVEILEKCVVVTNSIGNINEVDFIPISDEAQRRQIVLKYTGLFKNANQLLVV